MSEKTWTCLAVLAAAACGPADAAPITWSPAANTTNASDIVAGGAVITAINGTSRSGAGAQGIVTTVADVDFVSQRVLGGQGSSDYLPAGGTTGDAGYDFVLNNLTFGGGTSPSTTIEGLTDGVDYYVQVWFTDGRADQDNRVMAFGDGETPENTVNVSAGVDAPGAPPLGQYAIGTFTADGTEQALTFNTVGFGNAHVTAYLVREVPEPGSLALLALGGACLLRRRRTI